MSEKQALGDTAAEASSYDATSQAAVQGAGEAEVSRFFPMQPFWFLEELFPTNYKYLPTYVRVVHSGEHLVLLTGTIANLFLMTKLFLSYQYWNEEMHHAGEFIVVLLSFIFGLVSLQLLSTELVQYSVDLHVKSTEAQKSKDEMVATFHTAVADLDTMLVTSADTQAALAERSLDSHRRDLSNLLLKGLPSKLRAVDLQQFLAFVRQYLKIFEECSADPVEHPFFLVDYAELEGASPEELAEKVGKKAKTKEVKFLSKHVAAETKKASAMRQSWKRVTYVPRKVMKWTGMSKMIKKKPKQAPSPALDDEEFGSFRKESFNKNQEVMWLRWGLGYGFGIEIEESAPFPFNVKGGFFLCTVLSPEHFKLLISFFLGIPLLLLNVFWVKPCSYVILCSMVVTLACIAVVLYDFLDIDAIQRMEVQIKEMQAAVAAVEERRQSTLEFFNRINRLAGFWLHRTLPRLELMKICGDALEDAEDQELDPLLAKITGKV
ncbi:unnamed protein product, partial [Effrenium voratum]